MHMGANGLSNFSLQTMMNQMARGENLAFSKPSSLSHEKNLTELDAFIILDDLLASLNKQYLDAKSHRLELSKAYGADDGMTQLAVDMEDSAWCAMQTCFMELRAQNDMRRRANDMRVRHERQIEELKQRRVEKSKLKRAQDFIYYTQVMEMVKEKNRVPQIFELIILFSIFRLDIFGRSPYEMQKQKQVFAA